MKKLALLVLALSACTNTLGDQVPRLYACDRADGLNSCPSGWRCGLSGYCQDPAQPLAYACESSDDCSGAWHCGPERICYDRTAALDRGCRGSEEFIPDAGDCAPGWRCGREVRGQFCHSRDAGAGYLCTSDLDCEATWRCGPEGACVDVAAQRLRGTEANFTVIKVSPLFPAPVELASVLLTSQGHRAALVGGGKITLAQSSNSRAWGPPVADAGFVTLLRPAHALARTDQRVLVTDAMGLVDYAVALDGGTPTVVEPSLANAELRYRSRSSSAVVENLAAFSGARIGLCDLGTSTLACQFATLPSSVVDLAFLSADSQGRSALAATSAGPYAALRLNGSFVALDGGASSTPVWRPVSLPGLSDACSSSPVSIDRLFSDPDRDTLAATSDQDRRVSVFKRNSVSQSASSCAALAFDPLYGPCAACGSGETLLGMAIEHDPPSPDEAQTLCQRGGAIVGYRQHSVDGGCGLEPLDLPVGMRRGYAFSSGLQGVDFVGIPRECGRSFCDTMVSGSAPERVAGGPSLLTLHHDDVLNRIGNYVTPPSSITSAIGLQPVDYSTANLYIAGSVTENPDWMIGSSGRNLTVGDQTMVVQSMRRKLNALSVTEPLAFLSRSSDLLPSVSFGGGGLIDASGTRSFSTIAADAEGKPWLIIGAGDRLWAEDARLLSPDAGARTISIKVVPLPSSEIQSLSFTAADRGDAGTGKLLEGYVVAQQRLFRVVASSSSLWQSDEIRLGTTGLASVSTWMEQGHGRVGTSDGRVFGLPIPVALSAAIPEAPMPSVLSYGSLCGQAFALSSSALYRLSLDTPPLGTWKRVPLDSAFPGLDAFGPHWSAVTHQARVGNEEHFYLFSDTGLVVELKATCP